MSAKEHLNPTNVLLAVLLALGGWTLKETVDQGRSQAALAQAMLASLDRDHSQEKSIVEIQTHLQRNDAEIQRNQVQIAEIMTRLNLTHPTK